MGVILIKLYKHDDLINILTEQTNIIKENKIICVFGEKYFGKHTLANKIYERISSIQGCNVSIINILDCKSTKLHNDIRKKEEQEKTKRIFIVPFYRFDKAKYEELVETLYNNSCRGYCFILFMRPLKEIVEVNKNYDFCDNLSFLYYGIHPDNNIKNSNRVSIVHTPRLNEFRCYESAARFAKDDEYSYECICMESYYSDFFIPLIEPQDYTMIALIYGGVIINNALATNINALFCEIIKKPLMYDRLINNNLFWKIDSGYEVIDAWREFVIYKREYQNLVDEVKKLYLKIYDYKYLKSNKYIDISCLKQHKKLWFNNGYSLLYNRLYNAANFRMKNSMFVDVEHKCKLIPFGNRKRIASAISEYDGEDTKTLLGLSIEFFEETFDFNLLINGIENIYSNNSGYMDESISFVKLAIKTAIQWNDLTVLSMTIKLLIKMWKTDKSSITHIIDIYSSINGVSIRTIEEIFLENEGIDLMKTINSNVTKTKIFISFCGADEDVAELAHEILSKQLSKNYEILKYDHNVKYMDSLKNFMNKIEECKYVVMIVSDAYLKSEGCMYEVLETMIGHNYIGKMLPIFINKEDCKFYGKKKKAVPADIFGPVDNFTYSTYWADIKKDQQEKLRDLVINNIDNLMNIEEAVNRLKKQDDIMKKINEFISVLKDRWQISFSKLYDENFDTIIKKISE